MDSTTQEAIPFFTVDGTSIQAQQIQNLRRVEATDPSEMDTFCVTYIDANGEEGQKAWVSYHTYCMLKSSERAYMAKLIRDADALE